MSSNTTNNQDQEIDLSMISKKIGNIFQDFLNFLFKCILFAKKNYLVLGFLFVLGAVLGWLSDSTNKSYNQDIVVSPNFGSTEYLYNKIDFLNSKVQQDDSITLKALGIVDYEKIVLIKVKPVIEIYNFINNNEGQTANNAQNSQNFEFVKLLAEDGDINKIIVDDLTSKNYSHHTIHISTKGLASNKNLIDPIMSFLNKSEYYQSYQNSYVNNMKIKIKQNDLIITQIDNVLNQFTNNTANNQKSDKLVYYNENTQLNDVIKTKDGLINENGYLKNQLIVLDKIIKENSRVTNIKNTKGIGNKLKLVLPVLFIGFYLFYRFFKKFYKSQTEKLLNK